MKLRRPSPALVISCIALVVASSGTAFAATIITSSSQIKNGAVTGADIRNGTIRSTDIAKGTVLQNRLSKGVVRKLNSRGAGAGGPSTAYHAIRRAGPENQPPNVAARVASVTVPPGAYVVTASTVMTALPGPQNPLLPERESPEGICRLDAAGEVAQSVQNVVVNSKTAPATLFMQTTRTVGAPSEFFLECSAGTSFRLSESSIIVTRASDIAMSQLP